VERTRQSKNAENAANELYKKCKEAYGEKLVEVILYGSYARGDFSDSSDVDIMVIVEDDSETTLSRRQLCSIASIIDFKYDVFLSPAIRKKSDYEERKSSSGYYANIHKEGVRINDRR